MPTFSLSQSRDYSESEKDVYSVGSDTEGSEEKKLCPLLDPFFLSLVILSCRNLKPQRSTF